MHELIIQGLPILKAKCLERAGYKCEVSGRNPVILDNHHILPKSVYPQWYLEPMNMIILSREWHVVAEEHAEEFLEGLKRNPKLADRVAWVEEHRGINKYPIDIDYRGMFDKLMAWETNLFV